MSNQYLIYQSSQKTAKTRTVTSVLGVFAAAVLAVGAARASNDILLIAFFSLAITLFGLALILTLRKKREFELFEISESAALLKNHYGISFEGRLGETKLQRVRLPNGTVRIFLRNGVHAVELGSSVPQKTREDVAAKIENLLKSA